MTRPVKRRTIGSPLRREQAAETRRRILVAARRLFAARGYAGTTMSAIAKEAGVAVPAVGRRGDRASTGKRLYRRPLAPSHGWPR